MLDEAYFEYVDDPEYPDGASEQLARGRRCVVLRTFSKIYGLAGFRVGYGLCPPDVAAACLKVKNAFDVTQSALDAALASLGAGDEVARRRDETRAGRERLAAGLRERGFAPLEGVANFLCVDVGDGAAFASRLERQGVIVRPLGPFGDPASVRISVGSDEELDAPLRGASTPARDARACAPALPSLLATGGGDRGRAGARRALARRARSRPRAPARWASGKLYAALRAAHRLGPLRAGCELRRPEGALGPPARRR